MNNRNQKPVVIYRLGSLGDTVVALPCLHRIEQSFPDSERIALTNFPVNSKASPLGTILGDSGLIHRTVAYPVGMRSFGGLFKLRRELRALGSDTLVYLTPPRGIGAALRDYVFFRLCGFRRIVGAPLRQDLQTSRIEADGSDEPEYSRMARCLVELGPIDMQSRTSWDLRLNPAERTQAATLLTPISGTPYVAINMGGKAAAADWGVDNWLALIERLKVPLAGHALLVLGAAEDDARARQVAERWSGPVINACGRTSPRVSAAAAEGARLFIGHDSGPMHLCACVGVPCVGLFGGGNKPRRWHPHGSGHRIIHKMTGVATIT
ncbi:MAG: lipopolysaccharide heptosyltransferase family protein, partial [Rhizobacter sp.]|nr:lipopolysaccharide heptosyltransferase family protein [Rhizobacter sp.]